MVGILVNIFSPWVGTFMSQNLFPIFNHSMSIGGYGPLPPLYMYTSFFVVSNKYIKQL